MFFLCSPKKSSKITKHSTKSPKKDDSGKFKSAEFVETDESSSEDDAKSNKKRLSKEEVRYGDLSNNLSYIRWTKGYVDCWDIH